MRSCALGNHTAVRPSFPDGPETSRSDISSPVVCGLSVNSETAEALTNFSSLVDTLPSSTVAFGRPTRLDITTTLSPRTRRLIERRQAVNGACPALHVGRVGATSVGPLIESRRRPSRNSSQQLQRPVGLAAHSFGSAIYEWPWLWSELKRGR